MGFISAGITVMIGYFAIEFLKKNKEQLKDMPIVSEFIDLDNMDSVSYDAYFIVFAFFLLCSFMCVFGFCFLNYVLYISIIYIFENNSFLWYGI